MWRKKKFIIGLLASVLIIGASLGGVAYAQGEDEDSQSDTLLGRVADILGIDQQQVEDAFAQAKAEMQQERQDEFLQKLVDEGVITEEQAAEYKEWLESKPDMTEIQDQMKEWMESRPDMGEFRGQMREWFELKPLLPFDSDGSGFGFFRVKGGICGPDEQSLPVR